MLSLIKTVKSNFSRIILKYRSWL